jgi:hypothetical protein
MMRSLGMIGEAPEAPHCESVTSNDDALIADYLRRQVATEADNQQSVPIDTTPPSRKTES